MDKRGGDPFGPVETVEVRLSLTVPAWAVHRALLDRTSMDATVRRLRKRIREAARKGHLDELLYAEVGKLMEARAIRHRLKHVTSDSEEE